MNQQSSSEGGKLETLNDIEKRISDNVNRLDSKNIDTAKLEAERAIRYFMLALESELAYPDNGQRQMRTLKSIFDEWQESETEGKGRFQDIIDPIATKYNTDSNQDTVHRCLQELRAGRNRKLVLVQPYTQEDPEGTTLDEQLAAQDRRKDEVRAAGIEDRKNVIFQILYIVAERAFQYKLKEVAKENGNYSWSLWTLDHNLQR